MLLKLFSRLNALYLRLLGARRHRLQVGEVSLVYYVVGPRRGEPWVLLHGLGSVAATWSPVMRGLRRGCRILVPELSALGGTTGPRGGLAVMPAVEVLAALLEHEFGPRPATVAGLSLGGWVAVRFALSHPERVARLALVDAGGYREQDWDNIRNLVTVHDLAGIDRLYKALFVRVPLLMSFSRAAFLKAYTSRAVRHVLEDLQESDAFDDADLARLRMPTALIWADHDGLFTLETARAMAAAIPGSSLDVVRNCGHAIHMECPKGLLAAFQRFRRATAGLESAAETPDGRRDDGQPGVLHLPGV
jgi:pimeloyl-ACP methyl ester carboxylesterase